MDTFNTFIAEKNWTEAAKILKSLRDTSCKETSNQAVVEALGHVKSDFLVKDGKSAIFLTELFRFFRNAVIVHDNGNILRNDPNFLNEVKNFLRLFNDQIKNPALFKAIIQLLINFVMLNQVNCMEVSNVLYEDILDCFYKGIDNSIVLALLYNIHIRNKSINSTMTFYENVLNELNKEDCEYAEFLSEIFLYDINFWNFYDQLKVCQRVSALYLLKERWLEGELKDLPEISLQVMSKKFCTSDKIIFQTVSSNDTSLEPYEITLLLDILGSLCGNENYLKLLQTDKDLIINCGVLLINIHRLGKQSENYFTSIPNLSELKLVSEVVEKHPAFGFKVGLVRLIGNLCWKNKKMQDLVRETEIIPILLDCCNMDARNPLIMQWVILAIRNLCENNLENQAIIGGLHKTGTVSSKVIEEMGLTLQDDGNRGIRIVPLDMKK